MLAAHIRIKHRPTNVWAARGSRTRTLRSKRAVAFYPSKSSSRLMMDWAHPRFRVTLTRTENVQLRPLAALLPPNSATVRRPPRSLPAFLASGARAGAPSALTSNFHCYGGRARPSLTFPDRSFTSAAASSGAPPRRWRSSPSSSVARH